MLCSLFQKWKKTVGEAIMAYNSNINEHGVAPIQLVTGRIPVPGGDVLNNFGKRLAEHSLLSSSATLEKQLAIRETARITMLRLHYSRGLRQAELARSRESTAVEAPQPGDLVHFWRAQKYQSRKDGGTGTPSRRRLQLKRWHGPALLVAREGRDGDEFSSNCFVSFRGQLTKCPTEHIRKASSFESIAAGSWEAAIDEVTKAAVHDAALRGQAQPSEVPSTPVPALASADGVGLASSRWAWPWTFRPGCSGTCTFRDDCSPAAWTCCWTSIGSRVPSAISSAASEATPQPGAPVPPLILGASQAPDASLSGRTLERARQYDEDVRGQKRVAEGSLSPSGIERVQPGGPAAAESTALPADQETFEVCAGLTMTHEQIQALAAERVDTHPLLRLSCLADLDRREPTEVEEHDHGTWDGRWSFVCQRDWDTLQALGAQLPSGQRPAETYAVQAAQKEYYWSQMDDAKRKLWGDAALAGWQVYLDNQAVEALSLAESEKIRQDLARRKELDRIMVPRFVCAEHY